MEILQFKKRRRRLKKSVLLIVVAVLLVLALALALIAFLGGSEGRFGYARIEETRTYTAAVIRNEKLVSAFEKEGGYAVARYYMSEGQDVEAGEHIMDVFRLGFSRETELSLRQTRQRIYEEQLKVIGEVRNEQLKAYDVGIENAKDRLSTAVMNGSGEEALAAEEDLYKLLEARNDYLKNEAQENETLRALYREEEAKLDAVLSAKRELVSETGGRVSYYFDDLAAALNADKLELVTTSLVEAATSAKKEHGWIGSSTTAAYRLVDPGEFYCAFLTEPTDALRVAPGTAYPVELSGYGKYEAVGVACYKSGSRMVNIIKIESDVGALISTRKVQMKLKYAADGIRVEKRAVQYNDGCAYIEIMENGGRTAVYVDVLSADGGGAIVKPTEAGTPAFSEGGRYWIPKRLNAGLKKLFGR